jgi:predicted deacylase
MTQMPRFALVLLAAAAAAQTPGVEQRMLAVPAGADAATEIPLTVIRGAKPGPALGVVAGNHGYEYPPILAVQQLAQEIRATALSGTVYLVHIANLPGFLRRSLFVNPVDGKNLNRVYPGRADGSQSERIAFTITREVIEKCDALLDLHAGDGNESLRPYVYQTVTGDAALDARIAALAAATLFGHIVMDRDRPADAARSVYCSNTAITRGKPAVTLECGYLGTLDPEAVDRLRRAVVNVLRHLKMLDGEALVADHPTRLDPVAILPSPATGIYTALVERGAHVARGAPLARITDFFGRQIALLRAPFAGVVLYIIGTPPVNQGDPAVFLGAVQREPDLSRP